MSGPYQILMVDPPWPMQRTRQDNRQFLQGKWQSRPLAYNTLTLGDIGTMLDTDIFPLAAPRHVVFLWATEWMLLPSEEMMGARGYRQHTRLIWEKSNGVPLGTVRRTHEYLGWWYMPPLLRVDPQACGRFGSVIHGAQREHSRKPHEAYALIEALYPDACRLDAFTREYRPGWDGFGDQKDHFTPLLARLREVAG